MSDKPREPLVYDCLDPYGSAGKALVSIANSLAILADETPIMSPIVGAAFIVSGECDEDTPPVSGVVPS